MKPHPSSSSLPSLPGHTQEHSTPHLNSTPASMGTPRFLAIILVAALLALSFSQGPVVVVEGRKVQVLRAVGRYGHGRWRSPLLGVRLQEQQEGGGMVSTVMDYSEPKANTNPHGSVPAAPEDPTSPPWH